MKDFLKNRSNDSSKSKSSVFDPNRCVEFYFRVCKSIKYENFSVVFFLKKCSQNTDKIGSLPKSEQIARKCLDELDQLCDVIYERAHFRRQ